MAATLVVAPGETLPELVDTGFCCLDNSSPYPQVVVGSRADLSHQTTAYLSTSIPEQVLQCDLVQTGYGATTLA